MSKLLELVNTTSQTVDPSSNLNLGNVKHRVCFGAFSYDGISGITLVQDGWYLINFKIDMVGTAAGQDMSISMYADGVLVPETSTIATATAIGDIYNASFSKIARICNNSPVRLTFVNDGATATTYNNLIIDIVKVN